ncbi:BsuPI-related putative proteinase inhibitor [Paenibacillus filicis]|uniref:Intracellular proteinase inhibitor BsuPI domain-containing protein n=1 Tax=Paenibacillus filicis TaxID=669464 RepID=A0ABU9DQ23_9BACL
MEGSLSAYSKDTSDSIKDGAGYKLVVPMKRESAASELSSIKQKIGEHLGDLMEKHKVKVLMLGTDSDQVFIQVRHAEDVEHRLTEEELTKLRLALYELAGREFPLSLGQSECCSVPTLSGVITRIDGERVLIVNEDKRNGDTSDPEATFISLAAEGKIRKAGSSEPLSFDQLKIGQQLHVWTTGLMLQSYPGQASALKIEIIAEAGEAKPQVLNGSVKERLELIGGAKGGKKAPVPAEGLFETELGISREAGGFVLDFALRNKSGVKQPLVFGSGQQFEIRVVNEQGKEVYRWSSDKSFTMAIQSRVLEADDRLSFTERWMGTDEEGRSLPGGLYTIYIEITAGLGDTTKGKAIAPAERSAKQEVRL